MTTAADGPAVEVGVLLTGQLDIPLAYLYPGDESRLRQIAAIFRPGAETVAGVCAAYVVRHPSAGVIAVDTGFHRDAQTSLRRDLGVAMALFFGRALTVSETPYDEALRIAGAEPTEVRRAIMTHLHADHTSGMRLLPQASFVCAEREWALARSPGAVARGYVKGHLPDEERMELIDFERRGEPFGALSSTIDLLGDGSIRLLFTPGHTAGHTSVLLRVADGGQVLLVGDAAYTLRSLREEIVPLLTAGGEQPYRRSLSELRAFSIENPQAVLVPSHDPSAWQQLRDLKAGASKPTAAGS